MNQNKKEFAPWDDEVKPAYGPVDEPILDDAEPQAAHRPAATGGQPKKVFKQRDDSEFDLALSPSDVQKETEKAVAVLVSIQEGQTLKQQSLWFPRSQVKDGKLPGWLVRKKIQELRESGAGFAPISICGRTFLPKN